MPLLDKNKIDQAYVSLISSFRSAAGRFAVKSVHPTGILSKIRSADEVEVATFLYLPNWQYRAADTGKTINILIRGRELYLCSLGLMINSNVQVMYLEIEETNAIPLLALHYDFDNPAKPAHPYYHVQMGVTDFAADECHQVGLRSNIQPPRAPFYPSVRIPTPQMSLGAVLVGIAADHLTRPFYKKFIEKLRANALKDWGSSCCGIDENNANLGGNRLHGHHWYGVHDCG